MKPGLKCFKLSSVFKLIASPFQARAVCFLVVKVMSVSDNVVDVISRYLRITSYNVCYTKLLRDSALIRNYSDPAFVLGGWNPVAMQP